MSQLIPIGNMPVAPEHASTASALMQVIVNAASDPRFDLDHMKELFLMHRAMEARDEERLYDAAMAEAQSTMRGVAADASNPQTRSKYASYYALDRAVRPIYTHAGFALHFYTSVAATPDFINVGCRVTHRGGCARTQEIPMPSDGKGARGGDVMTKTHAIGSAVTYGMRYLLKMIFNLAVGGEPSDDDGNAASGIISAPEISESMRAYIDLETARIAAIDDVAQLRARWLDQRETRQMIGLVKTTHGAHPGYAMLFGAFAKRGKELTP